MAQPRDFGIPPRKAFGTDKLIGWRFWGRQIKAPESRAVAAAAVQNALAERVRTWLGKEGISQEELANRLGISFSVLNKKLSGEVAFLLPDLLWLRDLKITLTDGEMAEIGEQAVREAEYEWRRRHPPLPDTRGRSFEAELDFGPGAPGQRVHPSQLAAVAATDSMRRLSAARWSVPVSAVAETSLEVLMDVSADVDGSVLPDGVSARLWLPSDWEDERRDTDLTLVGNHFVVNVLDWEEGRPVRALLLRAVPRPFTAGSVPDDPVWALSPATLTGGGIRWDEPDDLAAAAAWDVY